MAEKTIKTRIQQRFATWAEWQTVWENIVPLKGEICKFQIPANTNTDNFGIPTSTELRVLTKTGDGETLLKLLPWDSATETQLSISKDDSETTTLAHGGSFTAVTDVDVSKHLVTTSSTEFTLPEETQLSVTGSRTYTESASFGSTIKVMTDLQVEDHGIEKHYTDFKIPNLPDPAVQEIDLVTIQSWTPSGGNWGPLRSPVDAVYKMYVDTSEGTELEYPDGKSDFFLWWAVVSDYSYLIRPWHGDSSCDPDFDHWFRYSGRVTFDGEELDSWKISCDDECGEGTFVYTTIITDTRGIISGVYRDVNKIISRVTYDETDGVLRVFEQDPSKNICINYKKLRTQPLNTVTQLAPEDEFTVITDAKVYDGLSFTNYSTTFKLPPAPEIPEADIECKLHTVTGHVEASDLLVTAGRVGDSLWKFTDPLNVEAVEIIDGLEENFYSLGQGDFSDHLLYYSIVDGNPVIYKTWWDSDTEEYVEHADPDYLEPFYYKGAGTFDGVLCDVWVCNDTCGAITTIYTQKIIPETCDDIISLDAEGVFSTISGLRVDQLDKGLLRYTTKSFKLPQETPVSVTSNFSSLNPEHGDLITVVTDVTEGESSHDVTVTKSLLQLPYMDINSIKRKLIEVGDLREVSSSYVSSYAIENGSAVAIVNGVEMFDTFLVNDSYNTYDVSITYQEWAGTVSDFRILAENTGTHKVTISRKDGYAITESEIMSQTFNELVEHIKNGFSVYFNKLYRIILAQEVDPENIGFDTTKIIAAE